MNQAIYCLGIATSITLSCLATLTPATAEIVPDNTLPVNSTVTPGGTVFTIDGGTVAGSNLFHSFQAFSVPTGGEAIFNNGFGIQNILTRVTGNLVSIIDGIIRTNGTANLFFLNPNGIIFGQNATLNIGGSFFASTASSLLFNDGTIFSAKPPTPINPLLTISVPIGLQYGSNPGSVQVQGSKLQVSLGHTLALVGGNVSIEGGQLLAPGGRVELGGLAGEGIVGLVANGSYLGLSFPVGVPRTDVSITNGAQVNVSAGGGGTIAINARSLNITGENTRLQADIAPGLGSVDSKGGDINITTGSLFLTNGAELSASTFGKGDAGSVNINATNIVSFDGGSAFSRVAEGAVGNGGNINITTGSLFATNGAQINTSTSGQGNGGSVNIVARDTVSFDGMVSNENRSAAYSNVEKKGVGNSGNINITTGSLFVTNGAQLWANTRGQGNGGRVTIKASDTVYLNGVNRGAFATVASDVIQGAVGNGNDINITARSVFLVDNAVVAASILEGKGENGMPAKGGNVIITASDIVSLNRSAVYSEVGANSFGNGGTLYITAPSVSLDNSNLITRIRKDGKGSGGNINITTGSLSVMGRSQLGASTYGQGDAGSVNIVARDTVSFNEGDAFSRVESTGVGNGGDINITTGSLFVTNGTQLSVSTFGQGNGGNLTVNASQQVQVIGRSTGGVSSGLFAQANEDATGKAGDLTIYTGTLLVRDGAQVSASTFGQGDGGNLTVHASQQVQLIGIGRSADGDLVRSGLFAQANQNATGKAGDLTIYTGTLLVQDGARVSVLSSIGQAGNLNITANSLFLNRGTLIAQTAKSDEQSGANITLSDLELLQMENESRISAEARGNANGGNISIDTKLLVALPPVGSEGSDINATARQGSGGRIEIKAQGIFGIRERKVIPGNRTNDIDASSASGTQGTVILTTSPELISLSQEAVDPTGLISQQCAARGEGENKFTITGQGGLPQSPTEVLAPDLVQDDLGTLTTGEKDAGTQGRRDTRNSPTTHSASYSQSSIGNPPRQLVEAQGWIISRDGKVILTAQAPEATPHSPWQTPANCQVSQRAS
jgi:filamentous hemagglutinin family protein